MKSATRLVAWLKDSTKVLPAAEMRRVTVGTAKRDQTTKKGRPALEKGVKSPYPTRSVYCEYAAG